MKFYNFSFLKQFKRKQNKICFQKKEGRSLMSPSHYASFFSQVSPVFSPSVLSQHPPCNGTPLQYSCLEHPMDGGAWKAAVHGVAEGQTRLSDFTFSFHFHALEKEMATRSSVLTWRIPGMGEPGGLPSVGSHRVGHD